MAKVTGEAIWLDGEFVAWDAARVHVLTHTLHYGLGVFEGIRCYQTADGRSAVFRLGEHLRRLYDSAHINLMKVPFERAQIELRAGVVLAAAGLRDEALERLCDAYRTASKLGARPLAAAAAHEVAALGESVAQRLGSRAAARADGVQLTRRELEVLRHVSIGRTNREIAQELFLSPRTVDMHVRNLLGKLDCRSRVEASHRAGELGLLR